MTDPQQPQGPSVSQAAYIKAQAARISTLMQENVLLGAMLTEAQEELAELRGAAAAPPGLQVPEAAMISDAELESIRLARAAAADGQPPATAP